MVGFRIGMDNWFEEGVGMRILIKEGEVGWVLEEVRRVGNIMGIIEMESNIMLYYKRRINIGFRIFIDGEWKNEWNIKVER